MQGGGLLHYLDVWRLIVVDGAIRHYWLPFDVMPDDHFVAEGSAVALLADLVNDDGGDEGEDEEDAHQQHPSRQLKEPGLSAGSSVGVPLQSSGKALPVILKTALVSRPAAFH